MQIRHEFLSYREAAELTGLSAPTIRSLVARNLFPAPVRLTERKPKFLLDDVEGWLNAKVSERDRVLS
jgi:excisionase family DNA binding protein